MKNMKFVVNNIVLLVVFNFACVLYSSAYDITKSRVFEVMHQGPGGIDRVNKQVLFAQTKNIAQDLNLDEIARRFGCKTKLGQAFILLNLKKPISPYDQSLTIQHRQKLIKFLVKNPEILEKLKKLIIQAVEHEAIVMQFMQKRFVLDPNGNPFKFVMQYMKKNPYIQTYNQMSSLMAIGTSKKLIDDKIDAAQKSWNEIPSLDKSLSAVVYLPYFLLFFKGIESSQALYDIWSQIKNSAYFSYKLSDAVYGPVSAALSAYYLYDHYIEAFELRKSLYALNQLVQIAKEIETTCHTYDVNHQYKVSSIRSKSGVELLDNLNQDRYKEKDSYFFITTAAHTFIHEVYEQDMNLAAVYASIAEIDAYVALAEKMIALQADGAHQFCFAKFLDDPNPTITAKGFWNLLVSQGKVVVNNLSESRNIILTGANEGGKTTTIRAILQNIVLAQTFGIAAANEFIFTPFTKIHAYLNVSDDILSGKSRYAFELQQAKSILDQIEGLQQEDKFFFVLDELFTGTNGEDGAQAAYDFIDNIASFPKIQFIYATHFNRLKEIGSANPACANYKIDPPLRDVKGQFIRDEQGEFIYPYTLSPGANDINVALERAKDAGIFKKKVPKAV